MGHHCLCLQGHPKPMVPEHTLCLNFSEKLGTILSFVISVRAARTAENVVWATHLTVGN